MNSKKVGETIASLRRMRGLTQGELGERISVSFQAVSKWERGETLPDTALLVNLADVLGTTVDHILRGGETALCYKGCMTVEQARNGLLALKTMGEQLGREHMIYRYAVEGINAGMNTSIEDAFGSEQVLECFVAEVLLQALQAGKYVDLTDVRNGFKSDKYREIVSAQCMKCGIV